jgi:hypothetical protein
MSLSSSLRTLRTLKGNWMGFSQPGLSFSKNGEGGCFISGRLSRGCR